MSTGAPTVSVLLPVYNGEAYLAESVRSILDQTWTDLELLVLDDGSTDASHDLAAEAARGDSRVRLIRSAQNRGLPATLNEGLRQARGHLVARQDADDVSLPERLRLQVARLRDDPGLSAVGSWFESMDAEGRVFGQSRPADDPDWIRRQLERGANPIAHGSVVARRDALESAGGYDERFRLGQDLDLWLRLFCRMARRVSIVPEVLYRRRKLPAKSGLKILCQRRYGELALQQHRSGQRIDFEDVDLWARRQHTGADTDERDALAHYWLLLGLTALENSRSSLARDYGRNALREAGLGLRLKAACLLAMTLLPRRLNDPLLSARRRA